MSDQHDPRPDDRMGLEAFDAVDAPDQWGDITRRADGAELAPSSSAGKRRSPATWFMAAAAVALVAVAAVAVSVRSGDDSAPTPATTPDETLPTPDTELPATTSPTPDSVPVTTLPTSSPPEPASTVPDGTVPLTTEAPDTTPTTEASSAIVTAWDPDCVDRAGDAEPPSAVDEVLTQFTTVAAEPSLDIALPTVESPNGVESPLVSTAVVPGGVAMVLDGYLGSRGYDTTLLVIDADGGVRWRRCLEANGATAALLVPSGDADTLTHVSTHVRDDDVSTVSRTVDLGTGDDVGPPVRTDATDVADTEQRRVLVAKSWNSVVEQGDELVLVDVDGSTDVIPYPDVSVGGPPDAVRFEIVDIEGQVFIAGTTFNTSAPSVVWTGDSWSSDPDDLRQLPPTLRIPFGNDEPLQLLDGAGDVVWEVDGFHSISREGFNNTITDSVVLAMECLDWIEDLGCQWTDENTPPREQLSAFDLETGERLWARPGGQAFAAIDGDRGIVTAEQGWELIDLRTGERVGDQPVAAWPQDDIWANECCGAGDYIWTRLDGGVLFESTGDRLRVWLPPEASTPTVTTDAFS